VAEFARLAAKVGFPGVDVATAGAMKEGFDPTRALLAQLKLTPAVAGFPVEFHKDDASFKRDLSQLEAAAQFVAAIGCPRMSTYILSSSERPKAEQRKIYKHLGFFVQLHQDSPHAATNARHGRWRDRSAVGSDGPSCAWEASERRVERAA
jgi:hypothetical protein